MQVAEKVALIIGAAHGIGFGTACELTARGARLCLVDHDEAALQSALAELSGSGADVTAFAADIGKPDAFDAIGAFVRERYGMIDILMNNVGVLVSGLPQDIPLPEWERIFNINIMGTVRGIHHFLPDMISRGTGHIVNTASFAGLFPYAYDRLPYAASKGALVSLTEGLALYCKPRGIGITLLCPGPVATAIGASMRRFTDDLTLRGPGLQFKMQDPRTVGRMVADAIEGDRFFISTDEQIRPILARQGADREAFLEEQLSLFQDDA